MRETGNRVGRSDRSVRGTATEDLAQPASSGATAAALPRRGGALNLSGLADLAERWGVIAVFIAVIIVFSLISPEAFATGRNALSIIEQASIIVLLAVGLNYVLAVGEFDLSFPYVFTLVSGLTIISMTQWGFSPALGVILGLLIGLATGLVNGLFVATRRASSFIVTLALGTAYTGLMYGIAGEAPITSGVPQGFVSIGAFHIGEITLEVIVMVVVAIIAGIVLRTTIFGRHIKATGSNPDAAAVAGVKVRAIRIGCFLVLGLCVGIAAVVQTSLSAAYYPTSGQDLFLPPFVAAFVGTSVLGRGQFTVLGTVVGALFIGTLQTGLLMQNIPSWVIYVVQGAVLLIAVMVSAQARRRRQ